MKGELAEVGVHRRHRVYSVRNVGRRLEGHVGISLS